MGVIYLITSPTGRMYVGQTKQPMDTRWKQHIDSAQRSYKYNCKVLNKSLRKHGHKSFKVEVLKECDNCLLDYYEVFYMKEYNTLVPNGMNIKEGGSTGKHNPESKRKISETLKGRKVTQEARIKLSSNKGYNLPMYLIKVKHGYRVCNHPMGPEKRFISTKKPDEYNLNRAMEYLNQLNNLEHPISVQKRQNEKYIQNRKNGFCVKFPNHKSKLFISTELPNDVLYRQALDYLNELKCKNTVQRLNDSGTEGKECPDESLKI